MLNLSFGIFCIFNSKYDPMKSVALFLCLFLSGFAFSQDLEDRDEAVIAENLKNINEITIEEPFYQIKNAGCSQFEAAQFPSGAAGYKEELKKYMFMYLNSDFYRLNGNFAFTLFIDEKGKITKVEGAPKIMNSNVFFSDMQYIIRRMKTVVTPAKCNGAAVASKMKIKMKFSSTTVDL